MLHLKIIIIRLEIDTTNLFIPIVLMGKCAVPCGTAIQGQHMMEPQQAADTPSPSKNQFNIEEDP